MARVKNGAVTKARHKKVLKQAKGYFGSKHRLYKTAKEQLMHSGQYAYRDRKQKKRRGNGYTVPTYGYSPMISLYSYISACAALRLFAYTIHSVRNSINSSVNRHVKSTCINGKL